MKASPLLALLLLAYPLQGVWHAEGGSFIVLGAGWGTPANPVEAGPGDVNVPLTITLQYLGATAASRVEATLGLPQGFTDINGASTATSHTSTIPPFGIFTLIYNLNIAEDTPLSNYTLPLQIRWDTGAFKDLDETHEVVVRLRGRVKLGFEAMQLELKPGQLNMVPIRVFNNGTGPASQISLTVTGPPQVSILGQPQAIRALPPMGALTIDLPLYVASAAAGAPITLSLSATYRDAYLNMRSIVQGLGLFVRVPEPPVIAITASPSTLPIGQVVDVVLRVANQGNSDLRSVMVGVQGNPPLALVNSDGRFFIGELAAGATASIHLQLYVNAPSATPIPLGITLTYIDSTGAQRLETRSFSFFTEPRPRGSPITLSIRPPALVAGRVNNVSLTLVNVADFPISGVTLSFGFTTGQIVWLRPDLVYLPLLSPGESYTFDAQIYSAPTAPSSTILQISLRYYDDRSSLIQETRTVGLLTRGVIELKVTDFSSIPERPAPGQVFSITVTLTNTGTITASAVTISPQPPAGFSVFGSRSIFVGDMPVNVPTTFTISLRLSNTTRPGSYEIPLEITFYDNLRNVMSTRFSIPLEVRGPPTPAPGQTQPGPELGFTTLSQYLLVAAVTLAAGYLLGRRARAK